MQARQNAASKRDNRHPARMLRRDGAMCFYLGVTVDRRDAQRLARSAQRKMCRVLSYRLDLPPGGNLVTANGPALPKVLVEMQVEMAVHADGIDRNGALIIEGVIAAPAQGHISVRRVN